MVEEHNLSHPAQLHQWLLVSVPFLSDTLLMHVHMQCCQIRIVWLPQQLVFHDSDCVDEPDHYLLQSHCIQIPIVELLLDHGADTEVKDNRPLPFHPPLPSHDPPLN